MPRSRPFDLHAARYEEWFEKHPGFYRSELCLIKKLIGKVPPSAVEVGVGSARFAAPLGVTYGVDPSLPMLKIARKRGVKVVRGVAEALPFKSEVFDLVLMVTAVCFVDDLRRSFLEARRVLKRGGKLAVALVDAESFLGRAYLRRKNKSLFYRPATFYTPTQIKNAALAASFKPLKELQTIFSFKDGLYPTLEGTGEGAFAGLLFEKP